MRLLHTAITLPLLVGLGCASEPATRHSSKISAEELLAGAPIDAPERAAADVPSAGEVLALTPEMHAFLDANVDHRAQDSLKMRQLLGAIVRPDTFGIQYDEKTRTASQTFRARRGNCLSFSIMFVAFAREAGLHVQFQEVDIPPDWTLDKETFVLNRHVNVRVTLEPLGAQVVDFNTADFRTSYDMRTISDERALAQFYNNVGVERMQNGDQAAALVCFRTAIADHDPRFSAAWTNLGTLYLRQGDPSFAEAAYLQALEADHTNLVVMSNLARLYDRQGDFERASRYRRSVLRHRTRNPYYRYQLAREAYAAGDYAGAIRHLKYALSKRKNEEWFYSLLADCYQQTGDQRAAERARVRAHELAATEASNRGFAAPDTSPE